MKKDLTVKNSRSLETASYNYKPENLRYWYHS